jgi:murein L,D-transpeptidase YcbB/YkuD
MFNTILKYKILILICISFVTFFACNSASETETKIKTQLSAQLKQKFLANHFAFESADSLAFQKVIDFYHSTNYTPIWINDTAFTPQGQALVNLFNEARSYGLWPDFYRTTIIQKLMNDSIVDAEVLLTEGFFLMTTHLQVGVLEEDSMPRFNLFKPHPNINHSELLRQIIDGASVNDVVLGAQPKLIEYKSLQIALQNYLKQTPFDSVQIDIPNLKDDSTKCYEAAKKALIAKNFISPKDAESDSLFLLAIKAFQLQNGLKDDGVVGKWTGRMLAKSNYDNYLTAAIGLERWRWKSNDTIPERYIWVNLPAYTLKLFDQNKLLQQHRVVVGAYGTQTPEFHAKMKRMVTNPFWYVPYSIASTEILSGIKKDTAYLDKRGYKLFRDGAEVDAKAVDWSVVGETNFRYHVRQDGGGGNSLGKIKFLFPNEHAVYIHDTPSKSLFWNDIRAYSHGCVRLHEPYELAKTILKLDKNKVVSDSIVPMINRGVKRVIELNEPIDVYIDYFTSTGDSLGEITFYPDIYKRDEKYISIFRANLK